MITITCALVPVQRSSGPWKPAAAPALSGDLYAAKYSLYVRSAGEAARPEDVGLGRAGFRLDALHHGAGAAADRRDLDVGDFLLNSSVTALIASTLFDE
jgi:hypothetical protein